MPVSIAQIEFGQQSRNASRRKQRRCLAAPLRFTAAGNADRKPFLRFPVQLFLSATFFEVGVSNNAIICNNRTAIEKTGIFRLLTMLV